MYISTTYSGGRKTIGVNNISATVDATENWWGSPAGPGKGGATTVSGTGVSVTPWLRHPIQEDDEKGNQGGDRGSNSEQ
jgi:hypothetical protein